MSTAMAPETPRAGPGVRQVLFVGDPRRLHFSELSAGFVVAPGMAPDLGAVQTMIRAPEDWRMWRGLFVDTAVARDVEVATFFERQQPALIAAGVRVVLLLDPRHAHLSPQLSRFAHIARADATVESLALALGLTSRGGARQMAGHVLVVSAKGGVGKTSVALAVAEYLSRVKLGCKVAVFDTDFFDGNVALSLGLAERARSIMELAVTAQREGVTPAKLERYLTRTDWDLDVLAAPASSTYKPGLIDAQLVAGVYDSLQALDYGMVVTDAPPDIRQGTPVSKVFFAPERLGGLVTLLIVGPRKFERDGFERMVDYLRGAGALGHTWLVYVQTRPYRRDKDKDLVQGLEQLARDHGLRGVAGQMPFDPVVEDAEEQGIPFWLVKPRGLAQSARWLLGGGSPFQRAAAQLARRVLEIVAKDGAHD